MSLAFILITTYEKSFKELERDLKLVKYATVKYIYPIDQEPWDAIAKVKAKSFVTLANYVLAVREKPGIINTKTLLVIRGDGLESYIRPKK